MLKNLLVAVAMVLATLTYAAEKPTAITLDKDNTVVFNDTYTTSFVSKKQIEIFTKVAKLKEGEPLYLVLDTPGGSVIAGNIFIDSLKALPNPIHTITIFAASMGYNTAQALGNRYIIPHGILMSHRATLGGLSGEIGGELEVRYNFYKNITSTLDKIAAERVGMSEEEYNNLVADEFWISGSDAVESNHADEVVDVRCSPSLMGTEVRTVRTLFGSVEVEFSTCPLIRGPLKVNGASRAANKINERYDYMMKGPKK